MARRRLAALLAVLAAVLVAVGLPLDHAHRTTRPARASAHADALLGQPAVRDALVSQGTAAVTDAVVDASGAPAASVRPAVAPLVPRVVDSPAFRPAWRTAVRRAMRQLLDTDRRRVALRVDDVAAVTAAATGPLPPLLTTGLQAAGDVDLASFRRTREAAKRTEQADDLAALGRPLVIAAAVLALLALALSSRRRGTLVVLGVGAALAGVLVVVAELVARSAVTTSVASAADRRVTEAVWDELLGGLRVEAIVLAAVGVAVAGVAAALRPQRPVSPRRAPPAVPQPRRPRRSGG